MSVYNKIYANEFTVNVINETKITPSNCEHLGSMNQSLSTTSIPTFAGLISNNLTTSSINSIVYVTNGSQIPSVINTDGVYIICNAINLNYNITISNCNVSFIGYDKSTSYITFSANTDTNITINAASVYINRVTIKSTGGANGIINNGNVGKTKSFIIIESCISGYTGSYVVSMSDLDIIKFRDTLFEYNYPNTDYILVNKARKVEFTSNEFIRPHNTSVNIYGTFLAFIKFTSAVNNEVINILTNIFHPYNSQNGISLADFMTPYNFIINYNNFITLNQTTGVPILFTPNTQPQLQVNNIQSRPFLNASLIGNSKFTSSISNTYVNFNFDNKITTMSSYKWSISNAGLLTYLGNETIIARIEIYFNLNQNKISINPSYRIGIFKNNNVTPINSMAIIVTKDVAYTPFNITVAVDANINDTFVIKFLYSQSSTSNVLLCTDAIICVN